MSGETNDPSAREQRVNEAIAAYLEAVDAGESPDPNEFVAQHSDIATELGAFFANRDEFDRLAEPLKKLDDPEPKPANVEATLLSSDKQADAESTSGQDGLPDRARPQFPSHWPEVRQHGDMAWE